MSRSGLNEVGEFMPTTVPLLQLLRLTRLRSGPGENGAPPEVAAVPVVPVVPVKDVDAAVAWFTGVLGFTEDFRWNAYAGVTFGGADSASGDFAPVTLAVTSTGIVVVRDGIAEVDQHSDVAIRRANLLSLPVDLDARGAA